MSDAPVKRKVGRPPKNKIDSDIKINGVTNSSEPYYGYEVLAKINYNKPSIIKKVFGFFNSLKVTSVRIIFNRNNATIYAIDSKNTHIKVVLDGHSMINYYCKIDEFSVSLTESNINSIVKNITADCVMFSIVSLVDSYTQNIIFEFVNSAGVISKNTIETIEESSILTAEIEKQYNDSLYQAQFTIDDKVFRNIVKMCDGNTESVAFLYVYNDITDTNKLQIVWNSNNKKVSTEQLFPDDNKINLIHKLSKDELQQGIRVSIKTNILIDVVTSFSFEMPIDICIDEKKKFKIKCKLDNSAITLYTLSDIIGKQTKF